MTRAEAARLTRRQKKTKGGKKLARPPRKQEVSGPKEETPGEREAGGHENHLTQARESSARRAEDGGGYARAGVGRVDTYGSE